MESKAVQPLLKKEAKKGRKILTKLGDIDNEKEFLDQINNLEFIFVKDGREIPPENQKWIEDNKNYVISISEDCHNFEPRDLLPRSSTMQRFIENDIYNSEFDNFEMDLNWLIDTGKNISERHRF